MCNRFLKQMKHIIIIIIIYIIIIIILITTYNSAQKIKKKLPLMNMLLIYLFASMKLEKGHKNYLAQF
jgi:hypothetical protein